MYESIIKGKAANCKIAISNTARARKVNLTLLSVQLKFLNFNANRSILETMSNEKTTVMTTRTTGLNTTSKMGDSKNGRDVIKNVFAGVGRPLKESDCVSSRLKIANRKAEQTAMSIAMYGTYENGDSSDKAVYINNAGTIPKLTMSASESNSLPSGDEIFSHLAANPSKKSKIPATQTK